MLTHLFTVSYLRVLLFSTMSLSFNKYRELKPLHFVCSKFRETKSLKWFSSKPWKNLNTFFFFNSSCNTFISHTTICALSPSHNLKYLSQHNVGGK